MMMMIAMERDGRSQDLFFFYLVWVILIHSLIVSQIYEIIIFFHPIINGKIKQFAEFNKTKQNDQLVILCDKQRIKKIWKIDKWDDTFFCFVVDLENPLPLRLTLLLLLWWLGVNRFLIKKFFFTCLFFNNNCWCWRNCSCCWWCIQHRIR